jgi:hypothetical protein
MGFSYISGLFLAGAKEELSLMVLQESQPSIFDISLCQGHFFLNLSMISFS